MRSYLQYIITMAMSLTGKFISNKKDSFHIQFGSLSCGNFQKLERNKLEDYHRAADFINHSDADVICLQHEFGLFGGNAGDYIFALLLEISKPVITTMHTVILEPELEYRVSTEKLVMHSDKLVVMSQTAVNILKDSYGVSEANIEVIFHGMPDYPLSDCGKYKKM